MNNRASLRIEDLDLYERARRKVEVAYIGVFKVGLDSTFKEYIAASLADKAEFDREMKRIKAG